MKNLISKEQAQALFQTTVKKENNSSIYVDVTCQKNWKQLKEGKTYVFWVTCLGAQKIIFCSPEGEKDETSENIFIYNPKADTYLPLIKNKEYKTLAFFLSRSEFNDCQDVIALKEQIASSEMSEAEKTEINRQLDKHLRG